MKCAKLKNRLKLVHARRRLLARVLTLHPNVVVSRCEEHLVEARTQLLEDLCAEPQVIAQITPDEEDVKAGGPPLREILLQPLAVFMVIRVDVRDGKDTSAAPCGYENDVLIS